MTAATALARSMNVYIFHPAPGKCDMFTYNATEYNPIHNPIRDPIHNTKRHGKDVAPVSLTAETATQSSKSSHDGLWMS